MQGILSGSAPILGPPGPGLFTLTLTEGPAVLNGTRRPSSICPSYNEVNFDNGNAWTTNRPAASTWSDKLVVIACWLPAADGFSALTRTIRRQRSIPGTPGHPAHSPQLQLLGHLDGQRKHRGCHLWSEPHLLHHGRKTPTTNSPAYASPFVLTNTTTINLLASGRGAPGDLHGNIHLSRVRSVQFSQ